MVGERERIQTAVEVIRSVAGASFLRRVPYSSTFVLRSPPGRDAGLGHESSTRYPATD
jgi:hypothetical protein